MCSKPELITMPLQLLYKLFCADLQLMTHLIGAVALVCFISLPLGVCCSTPGMVTVSFVLWGLICNALDLQDDILKSEFWRSEGLSYS